MFMSCTCASYYTCTGLLCQNIEAENPIASTPTSSKSYMRRLQYRHFIIVSTQNMGSASSWALSSSAMSPFLLANFFGFSSSVHANSCSHTCQRWTSIAFSCLLNEVSKKVVSFSLCLDKLGRWEDMSLCYLVQCCPNHCTITCP